MLDDNLSIYEDLKKIANIKNYFLNKFEEKYWFNIWDNLKYKNIPDSWAYRWLFICISNKGLSITPNINSIDNIGFDYEASNTKIKVDKFTTKNKIKLFPKNGLLKHPKAIKINFLADKYTFLNSFKIPLLKKILKVINF